MDADHRNPSSDDRQVIVSAAGSLLPSLVALTGSQYVNPSLVDGVLQALSEMLGLDPTRRLLDLLEKELLDQAFPFQIEIIKGPWFEVLPHFLRSSAEGLCAVRFLPLGEENAASVSMVFRCLVCFTEKADAAFFRVSFC